MCYLILLAILVSGCAGPRLSVIEQTRLECQHAVYPVVEPYVADWPRKKARAYYRHVVNECVAMELAQPSAADALYLTGAALQGYSTGFRGAQPFGAPNSIGPYGTLGPTWNQFNTPFQQPTMGSDPMALTPLVPPGMPPVNPRYLHPY